MLARTFMLRASLLNSIRPPSLTATVCGLAASMPKRSASIRPAGLWIATKRKCPPLSRGSTKMVLENSYFDHVNNPWNIDDPSLAMTIGG